MTNRDRIIDLLFVAGLMFYYVLAITFLYKLPFVLLMLVIPIPVILASRYKALKYAALMAICGMLFGSVAEIVCVYYGLWFYPYTGISPFIPLWIVVGWSCMPLSFLIILRAVFAKDFHTGYKIISLLYMFVGLFALVFLFVLVGKNLQLALGFALLFAFVLLLIIRTIAAVILFALGFIVGPMIESIPISAGAWSYLHDQILGMPYWMPIAYGSFAVLLVLFSETLASLFILKRKK